MMKAKGSFTVTAKESHIFSCKCVQSAAMQKNVLTQSQEVSEKNVKSSLPLRNSSERFGGRSDEVHDDDVEEQGN